MCRAGQLPHAKSYSTRLPALELGQGPKGFVEGLQGIIVRQLWSMESTRCFFTVLAAMQMDVDRDRDFYDDRRSHQG